MKTIVITGSTDGLGKALAYRFANLRYRVVLHGRNQKKGNELVAEIRKNSGNEYLYYYNADFEEVSEVYRLGKEIRSNHPKIDILINNAGIGYEAFRRENSSGTEVFFQVNFLAPYLLSLLLIPSLNHKETANIVNIVSSGQSPIDFTDVNLEKDWSSERAYCQSKFALTSFTYHKANFFINKNIQIVAVHPASSMPTKMIGKSSARDTLEDGVKAVLNLVKSSNDINGRYFYKLKKRKAIKEVYERERWNQLIMYIQPLLSLKEKNEHDL